MSTLSDTQFLKPYWRQIETIIREAEKLSDSTDWRQTAKEMRSLRDRMQTIDAEPTSEQATRFRIAQQIFMDRRAEFFAQGNIEKRASIIKSASFLQQQISQLQESIDCCDKTLADFNQQLAAIDKQEHQEQIKQFIKESVATLEDDILQQKEKLDIIEEEIHRQSSYYCGP
jgi:hypothetical protein